MPAKAERRESVKQPRTQQLAKGKEGMVYLLTVTLHRFKSHKSGKSL
jgi:hypothetical protein